MHTGTLGGELRGRGLNTTPRVPALASRLGHASRGARCPHLRAVSDWHSFDQTEYRRYPRGFSPGWNMQAKFLARGSVPAPTRLALAAHFHDLCSCSASAPDLTLARRSSTTTTVGRSIRLSKSS
jgi:hypothetical protein